MKRLRSLVLPLALIAVPGCSSSGPGKSEPKSTPVKASAPSPEEAEKARQVSETVDLFLGGRGTDPDESPLEEPTVFITDEKTGKQLERIPKGSSLRVKDGRLLHTLLNPRMYSLKLVREDEKYYYVEVPPVVEKKKNAAGEVPPRGLKPIVELPESEYEVVAPKTSKVRLRFEEKSGGLPTSGFWRSNMDVADLDGDGTPEIVTGPPRLAGGLIRIFRFDGAAWREMTLQTESAEEGLGFTYGGVAVADMDGDGKKDVVGVGHGSGPVVAYNLGGWRFRLEARGLPRQISGRALGAGDIDGDGRPDLVVLSDEPESLDVAQEKDRNTMYGGVAAEKSSESPEDYRKGFDMRAFFAQPDGSFLESTKGFEKSCYGYTLSLAAPPARGGAPFFVSGCLYLGGRALLYDWDASEKAFRHVGRGVVEEFSLHNGTAVGTYKGFPAAFASYLKINAARSENKSTRGQGVSIYYRDPDGWKKKRLVKDLAQSPSDAQGLGVGDLNGDGLDDVAWADDSAGRIRVFFQTAAGEFEELDPALQPKFVNRSQTVKVVDVDGDGRKDLVLMYQFATGDKTRAGGLRFFRTLG